MYASIQYDYVASIQTSRYIRRRCKVCERKGMERRFVISFGKSSNNLTNLTSAPARFFYFSNPHRDLPLWRRGKPGEAGPHVGLSTNALQDFNVCQFLSIYPLNIKYIFVLWIHHTDINLVLSDSEHPFPVLSESCSVFFCFANWVESTSSRVFGVRYKFCKLI